MSNHKGQNDSSHPLLDKAETQPPTPKDPKSDTTSDVNSNEGKRDAQKPKTLNLAPPGSKDQVLLVSYMGYLSSMLQLFFLSHC